MLFERFEDKGLSHYSYAVGCKACGAIAIVDPRRDIDIYLEFASSQNVAIAYVLETHIHADFASGASELAARTGARLMLSALDRGELYEVKFPHQDLNDGQEILLGSARIAARHTPGHTPEHLSFLVYDANRAPETPQLMLSGDFLFVGSLGRPDLLGEEAKRGLAERLYDSVQRLVDLPDGVEVHPAHGSGSMCGAGMSDRPMSTLGFERVANPYLRRGMTRAEFVAKILGGVPPFPPYYRRMKALNSSGPRALNGLPGLEALELEPFKVRLDAGAVVIDLRDQLAFGGGHIPGAFGIGAGQDVSTWASWAVPYDTPILLVDHDSSRIEQAVRSLVRVGLDQVEGHLKGGMNAWIAAGLPASRTAQLSPAELHDRLQRGEPIRVIDVRSDAEWRSGHVDGATHIMGGLLPDRTSELMEARSPLAVVCGAGYRSTVAASVLERAGVGPVYNVTGGMTAWTKAGLPTTTSAS
ncbi:MAG TPA: MBL fold metallo-hydrolase [Vicinamibacterales bacterium]|nr:MBL fold metallo-hydrolase [Vicinamibacterales bacterium]